MTAQEYIDSTSTQKMNWMKAASENDIREMQRQVTLVLRTLDKYGDTARQWRKTNAVNEQLYDWVRSGKPVWATE